MLNVIAPSAGAQSSLDALAARAKGIYEQGNAAYSSAKAEAIQQAIEKLKDEFGEEIIGMFEALQKCSQELSGELGLASSNYGMMVALPLVQLHDVNHEPPATRGACNNALLMSWGRYWLEYAKGAYGLGEKSDSAAVQVTKGISDKGWAQPEVLFADLPSKELLPGHFVAVDAKMRAVILGVRGTTTASDAIIDAVGHNVELPEMAPLQVHAAMLDGARKVLERTRPKLEEAFTNNPGFQLIVTGHSLGAGTATLCSVLLTATPLGSNPELTCYAYAPPPVLSNPAHPRIAGINIFAFVNRNDAVPRASLHNIYQLGKKCMKVDALELGIVDRVALIRKGHSEEADLVKKDLVIKAAAEAQEQTKKDFGKFPPLFIGGKIFWINGPVQDGDEWPSPSPGAVGSIRLMQTSCTEFLSLLIKGDKTMVTDHLGGAYSDGMDTCGCKVDVVELAAQTEKEICAKDTGAQSEAAQKRCCAVQ